MNHYRFLLLNSPSYKKCLLSYIIQICWVPPPIHMQHILSFLKLWHFIITHSCYHSWKLVYFPPAEILWVKIVADQSHTRYGQTERSLVSSLVSQRLIHIILKHWWRGRRRRCRRKRRIYFIFLCGGLGWRAVVFMTTWTLHKPSDGCLWWSCVY